MYEVPSYLSNIIPIPAIPTTVTNISHITDIARDLQDLIISR